MIFLRLLLAPLVGALFVLGYAPFNLWFASLGSVLLFLFLLNKQTGREGFFIGWGYGLGLMGVGVSWVYNSMHIYGGLSMELASGITAAFCIVIAFFYALVGGLYCSFAYKKRSMFKDFKMPRFVPILLFSSLWTLAELGRSYIWVGFPWLLLGDSFIDTPLAHIAPLGGVFALSFLGAFIASTLYHLLTLLPVIYVRRNQYRFLLLLVFFILPWGVGIALQNQQWTQEGSERLPVLLVQANTPQDTKWLASERENIAYQYQRMTLQHTNKILLVWPEAAVPYLYPEGKGYYENFDAILRSTNTALIFGSLHRNENKVFNGVFTAGAGSAGVLPVYYKQTLVPMGEYIPFQSILTKWLPFLNIGAHPITPGDNHQQAFSLGGWKIAPSICYEITYSSRIARMAENSDFMLTVSNDSWFSDSLGPHQHLQIARMRALENQRYLIRSTNNGITAVINPRGKLVGRLPQFQRESLQAVIIPHTGSTPYQRVGVMPVLLLSLLFFLFSIHIYRVKTQLV